MGTFVTVGNATQGFDRLIHGVNQIAGNLPQPVLVQHGHTRFESAACQGEAFVAMAEFQRLMKDSDIVIMHAGAGSIIESLRNGKVPIVLPRLKRLGEHVDDHQLELARMLAASKTIILVENVEDLSQAVVRARALNRSRSSGVNHEKTGEQMAAVVENTINKLMEGNEGKMAIISSCGGHLTEARLLKAVYERRPHFYVINGAIRLPSDMVGKTHSIKVSERDWQFLFNLWEAFSILRKERPSVILSTGAGTVVPFAIIGKLFFRTKIIYIETIARVTQPSLSGKIMYRVSDYFFYQWESLKRHFPKGIYVAPWI